METEGKTKVSTRSMGSLQKKDKNKWKMLCLALPGVPQMLLIKVPAARYGAWSRASLVRASLLSRLFLRRSSAIRKIKLRYIPFSQGARLALNRVLVQANWRWVYAQTVLLQSNDLGVQFGSTCTVNFSNFIQNYRENGLLRALLPFKKSGFMVQIKWTQLEFTSHHSELAGSMKLQLRYGIRCSQWSTHRSYRPLRLRRKVPLNGVSSNFGSSTSATTKNSIT